MGLSWLVSESTRDYKLISVVEKKFNFDFKQIFIYTLTETHQIKCGKQTPSIRFAFIIFSRKLLVDWLTKQFDLVCKWFFINELFSFTLKLTHYCNIHLYNWLIYPNTLSLLFQDYKWWVNAMENSSVIKFHVFYKWNNWKLNCKLIRWFISQEQRSNIHSIYLLSRSMLPLHFWNRYYIKWQEISSWTLY